MTAARLTDAAIPALAGALDPGLVGQALDGALGDDVAVRDVVVGDVRYEPGARAEILYRVKLRDLATNRTAKVILVTQLPIDGVAPPPPPQWLLDRYADRQDALPRTPRITLLDPAITLTAFPVDQDLPTLFDALDPAAVRNALDMLWAPRGARVASVEVESLGYTPHNRAAFRYDVLAEDRRTHVPEQRRLIGKLHGKKGSDRLFAGAWALWRATDSRCRLAPPVGHLPTLGVTLQEQVRGERLGSLAGEPGFERRVRQTARALAALHDAEIPLATRRKPTEEARVVHRWSTVLMGIRPDLAGWIEKLRDRLAAALELRTEMKGPVHADFHHTNVLVDSDGITIIDLDEMAYGDPLLDVGRFLASLRIPSLRTFGNLQALAGPRDSFLEEYLRRRPEDEQRVRLYEAACLFTAAASAFRIQRPAWPEEVELLVHEAERVFATAGSTAAPAPRADGTAAFPVVDNARDWAQDVTYMQTLLTNAVKESYGASLEQLVVVPESKGEVLARYELKGRIGRGKWKATLHGVELPGGSAAAMRRMELLHDAASEVPHAPALPRPVLHIRQLGMLVVEQPEGERVSALLGTSRGAEAVEQVAQSLVALHGANAELERSHAWPDELRQLERAVQRLAREEPPLEEQALAVLHRLQRQSPESIERLVPGVTSVRPHELVQLPGRIGMRRVENAVLTHPFVPAADFLARLRLSAVPPDGEYGGEALRSRFVDAYVSAGGEGLEDAALLEAAALLRLACTRSRRHDHDGAAVLLRHAAALL